VRSSEAVWARNLLSDPFLYLRRCPEAIAKVGAELVCPAEREQLMFWAAVTFCCPGFGVR
jgi:hypothetical protein